MAVKYVDEYVEEMCDICYEYKYGLFVMVHKEQICERCCQSINRELRKHAIENE